MRKKKIIIMGAAGRDFHNFNVLYRTDPEFEVVAFTAAQIPFIEQRLYSPELSGPLYPNGIRVYPEEELARLIKDNSADAVVFSYSDLSHEEVMHRASLSTALGADFTLLGSERTMIESKKPVISVCAVRTGCGKSGVSRYIAKIILETGKTPVAIRHPMPYGPLTRERSVQRFASLEDITAGGCTIEEREEYEPLVEAGVTVYAGIDYGEILKEAEKEADIIIWDGGNNDLPFIRPDLEIVVADPLRAGDEVRYYPGEANLIRADVVIINKANAARAEFMALVTANVARLNPEARVVKTASKVKAVGDISGKRALVIEDGPTLTHGGMDRGAGMAAAEKYGAVAVEVKPFAVGSIKETFKKYPGIKNLLPAVGYSKGQIADLEKTINATPSDIVLVATPINLAALMDIQRPAIRVTYEIEEMEGPGLKGVITGFLEGRR